MKRSVHTLHPRPAPARRAARLGAFVLTGLIALSSVRAAELIYQEGFNDDGEAATPPRYTTTGRFASEFPHDPAFVPANTADQLGPLFWGHSSEVSIVGVSGPTTERRALMAWDGAILGDEVSDQFWTLFDATIDWLLRGKQNATIVFSIDQFSAQSLADHLISRGHTVVDDFDTSIPDTEVQGDLIIKTSNSGGAPGRFARVAKPVLTFSAADHDDMLVGTIGTTASFEAGNATIVAEGHPAAGGLTGSFPIVTGQHTWQLLGAQLPNGAITVANFIQQVPPTAASLADVDAMAAGTKSSDSFTETATELDYADGALGTWFFDRPIPGGATGVWGLVAKGQLNVTASGTYSFALGVDDGARLRIDKDKNGFSDADNVIVQDAAGAFAPYYGDLQLDAGVYDFEVTVFNSGGAGGIEMSVSTQAGGGDRSAIDSGTWELLGQTTGAVGLQGTIEVTAYVPTGDPEEIEIPLLVLLNGPDDTPPGSVYGGGPFTGFEGTGFFGGAGLNKFDVDGTGTPKTLTIGPINVAGKQNLKLTMAFAATFLDFETSDFLDVLIDPNNSGTFTQLIHFTAPSGNDKFFDDRSTKPGSPTRLGLAFQDVTYDLPAGATQLVIQIQATTTWFNEIVGFDNLRITAGEEEPPPPVGIPIAANLSVGAPRTTPGDGLWGEYWKRDPVSILVDGNTVRENGIDRQIEGFGPPTGTFDATLFSYTGNDLTEVTTWLAGDAASFTGTPGNLDDGAFRFSGFINIAQPGVLRIGTTSDDGSRIKIAGIDIINNDGSHGDATVDENVNFEAAGVYPIEITYFNGDWTSDGNNHSGNPDPSVHGGANFHLRINGATITPAQVQTYLYTVPGPNYIHQKFSAGAPLDVPGDGLWGEYWKRDPVSILVDGNTVRENGIDRQIEGFGPPSGTFTATQFIYTGNDLTEVSSWLGSDSASFVGTPGNLDDGAFRFRGFINVPQAGALNIGTTSDDGSRIKIAGIDVINNDGSHGDATVDATVNFAAAGVYPIEITYFNGDWTSDGNNHSGNPDPSVHGGANFRLRLNGADINAQGRQRFFRTANGQPPKNIVWVSFHAGEASPSAAAAGAGFTTAPDAPYTQLLRQNYYNVRRVVTADNAAVDRAVLEAADLVIISRSVPSGHYQDPLETAFWNGLSTPTMILGGYVIRQNRLGLMAGSTIPDTMDSVRLKVNDPSHPIFAGVALNANNETVNPYAHDVTFNGTVQRGISVVTGDTAAGGVVLATAITSPSASGDATGGLIIGEWQPGGTVSAAGGDTLGGHRLVFLTGSREQGFTSEGAGIFDLDPDGAKLFLNAVAYMTTPTGGAAQFTSVSLSNGMLQIEWTGAGVLETAPTVNGPWTEVAGATSPYSTPTTGPAAFFRLRQ